ncbi:MAG: aminotransferase class I/II-fold pyridoxal phosphate-dependent enzyme [Desulfobacter sp.]|nr:MAG: aminotransferase class I/II-fold pyridoxal phosphate-dependent enzyme [Desulfobacter sp.]
MALYSDRTRIIGTENAFKIGPHISRVEASGTPVVRLNLGEPDFTPPDWVLDEVIFHLRAGNTKYCDPMGLASLRQAIATQVGETRGLDISADQVCVFPGGKPAIAFTQQLYCNPGDEIIYPSPGFPIYESMVAYFGAVPVPLHLEESENFTFGADQLRDLITPRTKLIILNFPSNPTGGVADRKLLEEIAEVILSNCGRDVRVYSDEIYENIIFDGAVHASIASVPGMEKRTLIASGFSKSFAWTGGRIGYIVTPTAAEAQGFKQLNINYFSCIPPYNQEGARAAMEHPESRAWMEHMTSAFQRRRDLVVSTLNQIPGIRCQLPKGAFYAFPNISELCESLGVIDAFDRLPEELKQRTSVSGLFQMFTLYAHGVAVLDRSSFGSIGAENRHFIRLSLASGREELEKGLAGLASAGADRDGFARFATDTQALSEIL